MIALLLRDVRLAIRAGGGFGLALAYFLIFITLIPLALGPDQAILGRVAPGILWLGALLACLLSLDRMFGVDHEDGTLEGLLIGPLPTEALVLTKALAHWLTTGLPLALTAPLLGVLLHLPMQALWPLCLTLLLGTPALSLIGAFGAALTLGLRRGGFCCRCWCCRCMCPR